MYNPGQEGYFYLTKTSYTIQTGEVQTKVLVNDLRRGVKRLSEDAYCPNYGSTRVSMHFMNALLQTVGVKALQGVKAEMRFSKKNHYTLIVHTVSGLELAFKGVSGGYYGEGTRGCYDILKVCGFSEKQCQRAFEKETFTVSKRTASYM